MRILGKLAVAALLGLASATGAFAADAIALPVADGTAEVPVYDNSGFDWNGFYAGIYGIGQMSPVGGTQYGVGINLGVNAQFDYVLVGAEVALQGLAGGAMATTYGEVLGRVGAVVSDDVLVYAAAGYGIDLGAPAEDDFLLGGGVEFALADQVTLRAQYLHGFPISGGNPKDQVTLGANFHF